MVPGSQVVQLKLMCHTFFNDLGLVVRGIASDRNGGAYPMHHPPNEQYGYDTYPLILGTRTCCLHLDQLQPGL